MPINQHLLSAATEVAKDVTSCSEANLCYLVADPRAGTNQGVCAIDSDCEVSRSIAIHTHTHIYSVHYGCAWGSVNDRHRHTTHTESNCDSPHISWPRPCVCSSWMAYYVCTHVRGWLIRSIIIAQLYSESQVFVVRKNKKYRMVIEVEQCLYSPTEDKDWVS